MAFDIEETVESGVRIMKLRGELGSGEDQEQFRLAMMDASQTTEKTLILDMRDVTAVESHAVSTLLDVHRRSEDKGGKLVLSGVPENPKTLFRVARLHRIVDFYPDTSTALQNLTKQESPQRTKGVTIFRTIDSPVGVMIPAHG